MQDYTTILDVVRLRLNGCSYDVTERRCGFSKELADAGIGIFALSTYNTDYILVKKDNFKKRFMYLKEYIQ